MANDRKEFLVRCSACPNYEHKVITDTHINNWGGPPVFKHFDVVLNTPTNDAHALLEAACRECGAPATFKEEYGFEEHFKDEIAQLEARRMAARVAAQAVPPVIDPVITPGFDQFTDKFLDKFLDGMLDSVTDAIRAELKPPHLGGAQNLRAAFARVYNQQMAQLAALKARGLSRCAVCGEDLPESQFYRSARAPLKHAATCKPCVKRGERYRDIIKKSGPAAGRPLLLNTTFMPSAQFGTVYGISGTVYGIGRCRQGDLANQEMTRVIPHVAAHRPAILRGYMRQGDQQRMRWLVDHKKLAAFLALWAEVSLNVIRGHNTDD